MAYTPIQDRYEYNHRRANEIINTILYAAENFEMNMGSKPTVFMSYDLFAVLRVDAEMDCIILDKYRDVHTVCGYDIELIRGGSELLYLGYRVALPIY